MMLEPGKGYLFSIGGSIDSHKFIKLGHKHYDSSGSSTSISFTFTADQCGTASSSPPSATPVVESPPPPSPPVVVSPSPPVAPPLPVGDVHIIIKQINVDSKTYAFFTYASTVRPNGPSILNFDFYFELDGPQLVAADTTKEIGLFSILFLDCAKFTNINCLPAGDGAYNVLYPISSQTGIYTFRYEMDYTFTTNTHRLYQIEALNPQPALEQSFIALVLDQPLTNSNIKPIDTSEENVGSYVVLDELGDFGNYGYIQQENKPTLTIEIQAP